MIELDDEDQDSDTDVAGQFNLMVKFISPEVQLATLRRQLNKPDLTTDKLQEILDKLIKLDNNDKLHPDLQDKVLSLFSDTLDKIDLIDDYYWREELKKKIRGQGYVIDNGMAEKLQNLEAANSPVIG